MPLLILNPFLNFAKNQIVSLSTMMRHKNFIWQFSLCLGLAMVSVLLFNLHPVFKANQLLSWLSIIFFTIVSLSAYIFGLRSTRSKNNNDFSNVFIIITTVKLLICMFMVWLYQILVEPESKLFIIPFFAIYLIFTVFESHVLIRLGKKEAF